MMSFEEETVGSTMLEECHKQTCFTGQMFVQRGSIVRDLLVCTIEKAVHLEC